MVIVIEIQFVVMLINVTCDAVFMLKKLSEDNCADRKKCTCVC